MLVDISMYKRNTMIELLLGRAHIHNVTYMYQGHGSFGSREGYCDGVYQLWACRPFGQNILAV